MIVDHLLLGQPWESNNWTHPNRHLNTYTFIFKGTHVVLYHLPPRKNMVPSTATTTSGTFLGNFDAFFDITDQDSQVFCLASVLEIHAATVLYV